MAPQLRVLAGTSASTMVPITSIVNTSQSHRLSSPFFEGEVIAHIKGLTDEVGNVVESEYFQREDRKGTTWSIQVQGRFLVPCLADDILFGNTFDHPLKLPWGTNAVLKFMSYIDPTLEHDLSSSSKPWALSPLISTMPHFMHRRLPSPNPTPASSQNPSPSSSPSSHIMLHDRNDVYATAAKNPLSRNHIFPSCNSITDNLSQLHLAVGPLNSDTPSSSDDEGSFSSSPFSNLAVGGPTFSVNFLDEYSGITNLSASSSTSSISAPIPIQNSTLHPHDINYGKPGSSLPSRYSGSSLSVSSRSSHSRSLSGSSLKKAVKKVKDLGSKNRNGDADSKDEKKRQLDNRRTEIRDLRSASDRRSYFSKKERRMDVVFGPEDLITTDFCYGFMNFAPSLSLQLPGGLSFDLMKYWDGQPVRFVCCERVRDDDKDANVNPWGRIFWCVAIELVHDDSPQ